MLFHNLHCFRIQLRLGGYHVPAPLIRVRPANAEEEEALVVRQCYVVTSQHGPGVNRKRCEVRIKNPRLRIRIKCTPTYYSVAKPVKCCGCWLTPKCVSDAGVVVKFEFSQLSEIGVTCDNPVLVILTSSHDMRVQYALILKG